MNSQKSSSISNAEWEVRKSRIKRLYLQEKRKLKGEDGVITTMAKEGFVASKSQYEHRFRKWDFSKNLKNEQWHQIARVVNRRKVNGRESVVFVFGKLITEQRLRKELSRPRSARLQLPQSDEAEDPLASGVLIRSPSPNESPVHALTPVPSSENLLHPLSSTSPTIISSPIMYDPVESVLQQTSVQSQERDTDTIYVAQMSPIIIPGLQCIVQRESSPDLPPTSIFMVRTLLSRLSGLEHDGMSTIHTALLERLKEMVEPLLPLQLGTQLGEAGVQATIFGTAVFQLVNGILPINTSHINNRHKRSFLDPIWKDETTARPIQLLISYLERSQPKRIHQLCNCTSSTYPQYRKSLAKNLLTVAVAVGAPRTVDAILGTVIDPLALSFDLFCAAFRFFGSGSVRKHFSRIAVQIADASRSRSYDILGLRRELAGHIWRQLNPNEILELRRGAHFIDRAHLELLFPSRFLMPSDLNFIGAHLQDFFRLEAHEFLISSLGPQSLIGIILENFNDAIASWMLEQLLRHVLHPSTLGQREEVMQSFSNALTFAILRDLHKVINVLMKGGVQPLRSGLVAAVSRKSLDMTRRLLEVGLDPLKRLEFPDNVDNRWHYHAPYYRAGLPQEGLGLSALGEAIKEQFHEAIRLFYPTDFSSASIDIEDVGIIIVAACQVGDLGCVDHWVTFLESVDLESKFGGRMLETTFNHILRAAISLGNDAFTLRVLRFGMPVGSETVDAAIGTRDLGFMRTLLQQMIEPADGVCLTRAIELRDAPLVRLLLRGQKSLETLRRGLLTAIEIKDYAVIDILLEAGAQPDQYQYQTHSPHHGSLLRRAAKLGDMKTLMTFISWGADLSDLQAFEEASRRNDKAMLDALLQASWENYPKSRAQADIELQVAIRSGHISLVKKVIDRRKLPSLIRGHVRFPGKPVRFSDKPLRTSPLGIAILDTTTKTIGIVSFLLEAGADPNDDACFDTSMSLLSDRGFKPPRFERTFTPLQATILQRGKHPEALVELLIHHGADPNFLPRSLARTPLQLAAEKGDRKLAQKLLSKRADPNSPAADLYGATALQLAAIGGYIGMVEWLLHNGADINLPRAKWGGRTPFEGATEHGRLDMMVFLLKNGADIVSDGGKQVQRAVIFAKKNEQLPAADLAEKLYQLETKKAKGKAAVREGREDSQSASNRVDFDSIVDEMPETVW